jgi:hypothetical protein
MDVDENESTHVREDEPRAWLHTHANRDPQLLLSTQLLLERLQRKPRMSYTYPIGHHKAEVQDGAKGK